tara:strand:+ start:460 stop:1275 length:816 start_codon:yes stop_codon:yes gene_type:complete
MNTLEKYQLNKFLEKGYIVLNDLYKTETSLELSVNLIKIINSFNLKKIQIKNYENYSKKKLVNIVLKSLHNLELMDHKYIKVIYDTLRDTDLVIRMMNHDTILKTISLLMGYEEKIPLYVRQIACRIDMPKNETFSLDWHQEAHYTMKGSQLIQVWAPALNDIGAKNGSIKILEGSHKEGVAETEDYIPKVGHAQYVPKKSILEKYKEVQLEINYGQAVLFSNTLIHKSGTNISDEPRLTLLGHYYNPLKEEFLNNMEKKSTEPPQKNSYR